MPATHRTLASLVRESRWRNCLRRATRRTRQSCRQFAVKGLAKSYESQETHFILVVPSTKPITQGSVLIASLVTRNGTLATSARRNSVSKCFGASFFIDEKCG